MTPIVCVGETLDEREAGETESKVLGQVRARWRNDRPNESDHWSLRMSRSGRSERAEPRRPTMRRRCAARSDDEVESLSGKNAAASVRIQYGGSVKSANIAEFMANPTSTAPSSAAPASIPRSSPGSFSTAPPPAELRATARAPASPAPMGLGGRKPPDKHRVRQDRSVPRHRQLNSGRRRERQRARRRWGSGGASPRTNTEFARIVQYRATAS